MFYHIDNLVSRDAKFALIWRLATNRRAKSIQRNAILKISVEDICHSLLNKVPHGKLKEMTEKYSLYLLGQLVYGTVLVFQKQMKFLEEDLLEAVSKVKRLPLELRLELTTSQSLVLEKKRPLDEDDYDDDNERKKRRMDKKERKKAKITLQENLSVPDFEVLDHIVGRARIEDITLNEPDLQREIFNRSMFGGDELPPLGEDNLRLLMDPGFSQINPDMRSSDEGSRENTKDISRADDHDLPQKDSDRRGTIGVSSKEDLEYDKLVEELMGTAQAPNQAAQVDIFDQSIDQPNIVNQMPPMMDDDFGNLTNLQQQKQDLDIEIFNEAAADKENLDQSKKNETSDKDELITGDMNLNLEALNRSVEEELSIPKKMKRRKFIVDEEIKITQEHLRENINNFADTLRSRDDLLVKTNLEKMQHGRRNRFNYYDETADDLFSPGPLGIKKINIDLAECFPDTETLLVHDESSVDGEIQKNGGELSVGEDMMLSALDQSTMNELLPMARCDLIAGSDANSEDLRHRAAQDLVEMEEELHRRKESIAFDEEMMNMLNPIVGDQSILPQGDLMENQDRINRQLDEDLDIEIGRRRYSALENQFTIASAAASMLEMEAPREVPQSELSFFSDEILRRHKDTCDTRETFTKKLKEHAADSLDGHSLNFCTIAPPNSTSSISAARRFAFLLESLKSGIVESVKQDGPYGEILITLA